MGQNAHHATIEEDRDPVGEGEQLVQILGDEEVAAPRARCSAQRLVDRFGGADVDAAGGVNRDDQTGLTGKLAGEKELLLIPAGERAQLCPAARRLHVVIGNEAVGEGRDRPVRQKRTADSGGWA